MIDSSITSVIKLVKLLRIPITSKSIQELMQKHPDYPSMLTISDVLQEWKVPNAAYEVSVNDLHKLPVPFIAYMSKAGGEFVIITKVTEAFIYMQDTKGKENIIAPESFAETFSGNVLLAEPGKNAGEQDYSKKRRAEITASIRLPVILMSVFLLFSLGVFLHIESYNWQKGLLGIFKITGLIISVLLLIQSVDANNPLVQKICSGKNRNCQAILSSNAANLFGGLLTWSEVGYFYFSTTTLLLVFNANSTPVTQLLAFLNVLSLPYTFYSLYYQTRVARQWCILCCSILGLLWLEFSMLVPDLFRPIVFFNAKEWAITAICFISPVILWLFIKPHLILSQKVQTIQEQLNKFKNNEGLFQRLLKAQDPCLLLPEDDSLMLGNKDAEKIITIVTNPYCPPCAKAHKTLEEWLSVYNNFKLQVIFSTKSNGKDVAGHIISLARDTNNKSDVSKALAEWYNQDKKDYPLWSKLYPVENNCMSVEGILEKHEEWCESIRIAYTPTILINGNYLPIYYQLDDVKYFVM